MSADLTGAQRRFLKVLASFKGKSRGRTRGVDRAILSVSQTRMADRLVVFGFVKLLPYLSFDEPATYVITAKGRSEITDA